ncbi:MAG: hypothetical protein Kow0089_10740 [Desulfobulbaceae bacterium]
MRMNPRLTALIVLGAVLYISLSLYHWRQVKNLPDTEQTAIGKVLDRKKDDKTWVQITTASGERSEAPSRPKITGDVQPDTGSMAPDSASPKKRPETPGEQPAAPSHSSAAAEENAPDPEELRKALQHERSINTRQAAEIDLLRAELLSLREQLEMTQTELRNKENALSGRERQETLLAARGREAAALEEEVRELRASLARRFAALQKANERISGLADRLEEAERTIEQLENDNALLRDSLSETESVSIAAEQETERLQEELDSVREERERYLAETGRLHEELRKMTTRAARLAEEIRKARSSSEAMLRYGKTRDELVTPLYQEIEVKNARLADLEGRLLETEDRLALMQQEKEELAARQQQILGLEREKNAALASELKKTSEELEGARTREKKLTDQLRVLADQLSESSGQAADLRHQLDALKEQLAQATDRLNAAEQAGKQLRLERDQALQDREKTAAQLAGTETRLREAETRLEALRGEKEELAAQLAGLEQRITVLQAENEELGKKLTALQQNDASPLPEQAPAGQTAPAEEQVTGLESLREQVARLEHEIGQRETLVTQLREELRAAGEKLASAESEISSLRAAMEKKTSAARQEEQEKIDRLEQQLVEKTKISARLEQELASLKEKYEALRAGKTEADSQVAELEEKLASMETENRQLEALRFRIQELEEERNRLADELHGREEGFFRLRDENEQLKGEIAGLREERDRLAAALEDSDDDGIIDGRDNCPDTVAGAAVGPDGCEPDRDGDGLVDRLDLCPDSKSRDGIDELGCRADRPVVLSGLYFSGGSAELSPAGRASLDRIVPILAAHPEIRFEVAGHTDSIGERERNLTVSVNRARSVRDYLVEQGIAPDRLTAVGYGSDQPVASNDTAEGRAANRRVELRRLAEEAEKTAPAAVPEAEATGDAGGEGSPAR